MKPVLRRHPVVTLVVAAVVLVATGVALAPWWIDLAPVRAKIERAASSALAGAVTYERMELSWFPRAEVVIRSVKVAVPGTVQGAARTVHVSPALLPLLRGRVELRKIAVDGMDLDVTLNHPKDAERSATPSESDWTRILRSMGAQKLDVVLSRSRAALSRPAGRGFAFEGIRLEAELRVDGDRLAVTLSRLSTESPRLVLAGSLRADAAGPRVEAEARGRDLDVADVRAKLLSFAGDDPTVASIFSIVRGGTLTSFSFASKGETPGDLGALERMSIRATVKDAKVRVPGPELDLADVSADVALEAGALSAEHASARVGRSRASDGKLLLGLAKADDRLRIEARVRADLAEVPAILARVIPSRSFHEEIALVQGLGGSAEGRITIGDLKSDLRTSVDVSEMRLSAEYRRLPWPIEVKAGRFFFDVGRVGVSAMAGSLGRSTFSGLAARVRLGERPVLESSTGSLVVSLEDFLEGARSFPGAASLVESVRRLEGSLRIDLRRLAGPLARLDEASVAASGTFEEILIDSSSSLSLPPLSIASGRFLASDDALRVSDADVRTLDASLRVSGAWTGWRGGTESIEATVEGELGPNAIDWGWGKASLPARFRPAAPIALHGLRLSRAPGGALSVTGDLVVANGPRLSLDLAGDGERMSVPGLTITDGDSTAFVGFRREESAYDVRFKGRLAVSTVEKLLAAGQSHPGGFEGEFQALVPPENPALLTAEGALTATDFEVPTPAGPVTVERLDVRAAKNRFDVASSSLALDGQRFTVAGSATLGAQAVVLDMDVGTGELAWTRIEKVLDRIAEEKRKKADAAPAAETKAVEPAPETGTPGRPTIGGGIRVSVDSFTRGNLVFKPVQGDFRFGKDAITAVIRKAEICGISASGEARFLNGGTVSLDARVEAAGPDINVPLTCFGFENVRMTGSYEASAQVEGEGPPSELARALHGPLTFRVAKGRIGKATVLTRILGVLNATDVFAGESGTRVGEAIAYDAITLEGEVGEGKVSIREAAMKAPTITMAASGTVGLLDQSLDLMVLSHPLSTVDKVVQAVPVVRHILGHDFLAVAVKVTGTAGDPKVTVTPGKDVGKGLVGILERTVTLPVTIFEPPPKEPR